MTAPVAAAGVTAVKASGAATAPSPASLLPAPEALSGEGMDAALGALYALLSQQREGATRIGETRVQFTEEAQKKALERQREAEERERQNQADQGGGLFGSLAKVVSDVTDDVVHGRVDKAVSDGAGDVKDAVNSPAFWNDLEKGALVVAKVAAVVGSVALTVGSGGALAVSMVGAAVLLSAGGEVVKDTRCFGGSSGDVALGLDIGGAVVGGGAGVVNLTSTAADTTLSGIGAAAQVTTGAAETVGGVAHVKNAEFAANAQEAAADATQASHQAATLKRLTDWVVDELKTDDKHRQDAMTGVRNAIQANDQEHAVAVMPPTSLRG